MKSSGTVFAKALSISCLVMALYLARSNMILVVLIDDVICLYADQFAFPVEVSGDGDERGIFRELFERLADLLLRVLHLRPAQIRSLGAVICQLLNSVGKSMFTM